MGEEGGDGAVGGAERQARAGRAGKGDVLAVARLAGIMGAKRTADLVPLCHPLPLSKVALDLRPEERDDPIGDAAHSPVPGIVHRYPDRALLKAVTICPVYCRFCFRRAAVGPQAKADLMEEFHEQVEASVEAGAEVLTGGEPLDREGAYYPPTVLTNVPEGCPADSEELFGPAAAVFEVDDEEQAVEKANDTQFGLGASVWTEDRERGERLARRIDAGCVYVNQLVKSDPRVPFGGVKESGYGRELSGVGIREFVNRKTVWVE